MITSLRFIFAISFVGYFIACGFFAQAQEFLPEGISNKQLQKDIDSLKIQLSISKDTTSIKILNELSKLYRPIDQTQSIKYAQEAIARGKKIRFYRGIADGYYNIGFVNGLQNLPESSVESYKEAIKYYNKAKDTLHLSHTYNGIGISYWNKKDFDSSLVYFNKSLKGYKARKDTNHIATLYNNIGLLYISTEKYDEAIVMLQKAISIKKSEPSQTATLNNIAIAYTKLNEPEKALAYSLKSYQLAVKHRLLIRQKEASLTLSEIYVKLKDYPNAHAYLDTHRIVLDSLKQLDKTLIISQMQNQFAFTEKEKEITSLSETNRLRSTIFIISLVSLIVIIAGLVHRNNHKQKTNRILASKNEEIETQKQIIEQSNEELKALNEGLEKIVNKRTQRLVEVNRQLRSAYEEIDEYVYRASHDFRSPLSSLMGLANLGLDNDAHTDKRELFERIQLTSIKMDLMLRKLAYLHLLNNHSLHTKSIHLPQLVAQVQEKLNNYLLSNQYTLQVNDVHFEADEVVWSIIIENLLENALTFAHKNTLSHIEVSFSEKDGKRQLTFVDNGQGIEPELLYQVFNMFFRASEQSHGNGLGLYIVKKAVQLFEGNISAESDGKSFTKFIITY